MTADILKTKSKEDVLNFIRERLSFVNEVSSHLRQTDQEMFKKEHRRFDMSGYEEKTGKCTVSNLAILNEFADLGIYDYTSYLFLDFYKGTPTLYLKYFNENENIEVDKWSGLGTTEIIYKIFERTIFSSKKIRRRD
jgi:hypothetical protein